MIRRGLFLIITLLAMVVLFTSLSCDDEEGEQCCKCNCFDADLCDPIQNYVIRGDSLDCVQACRNKCESYYCASKNPESCDPETSK